MSSNVDRIASLEVEIAGYVVDLAKATDETRKDKLLDVITERSKTLNILLAQQSKHIFYSYHLLAFLVCLAFIFLLMICINS